MNSDMIKSRGLARTSPAALWAVLVLLGLGFAEVGQARLPIEQLQREYQGRYYFLSGLYLGWPACECGTPAPPFPRSDFYGDLDHSPSLTLLLVQDLAGKFYNSASIYAQFLNTTDGISNIEGQPDLPIFYLESDVPPVIGNADMRDPSTITLQNCTNCFYALKGYIEKLKFLPGPKELVSVAANGYDVRIGADGDTNGCEAAEAKASAAWGACGWYTTPDEFLGVQAWSQRAPVYEGTNIAYWVSTAGKQNVRSRIHSNPSQANPWLTAGIMNIFIKAMPFRDGAENCFPPVTVDAKYHFYEQKDAMADYYSVPLGDIEVHDVGGCPAGDPPALKGWFIAIESPNQVMGPFVALGPRFKTDPDDVECGEGGCSGGCSNNGGGDPGAGRVSVGTGSLHLRVTLGPDAYGKPAGYFYSSAALPSAALYTRDSLLCCTAGVISFGTTNDGIFHTTNVTAYVSDIANGYAINFTNTDNPPLFVSSVTVVATGGNINQMAITETVAGGTPRVITCSYAPATGTWTVLEGNGLRTEQRTTAWSTPTNRTDTILLMDNNEVVALQTLEQYQLYPWGLTLTQRTVGTGLSAKTTTWTYYKPSDGANYGQIKQVVEPTGRWERYQYDGIGRLISKVTQFGNNSTITPDTSNRVALTFFDDTHSIVTNIAQLLGAETARSYEIRSLDADHIEKTIFIRCARTAAPIDDSANLTNIIWRTTDAALTGRAWDTLAELNADGTCSVLGYTGDHQVITNESGVPRQTWSQLINSAMGSWPEIVDGTRSIVQYGTWGEVLSHQLVDIASTITTEQKTYT